MIIKMDERTRNGCMCHYTRILIEIDMTKESEDYVMFEIAGEVMFASLEYKQLPPFCNNCGIMGHSLDICQSIKVRTDELYKVPAAAKAIEKPPKEKHNDGEWVRKGGKSLEKPLNPKNPDEVV